MVGWGETVIGGVGGELPTIEKAATTLDQAIVWPSSDSPAHSREATEITNEVEIYGGGQIIGLNGGIILSATPPGE